MGLTTIWVVHRNTSRCKILIFYEDWTSADVCAHAADVWGFKSHEFVLSAATVMILPITDDLVPVRVYGFVPFGTQDRWPRCFPATRQVCGLLRAISGSDPDRSRQFAGRTTSKPAKPRLHIDDAIGHVEFPTAMSKLVEEQNASAPYQLTRSTTLYTQRIDDL
jgi:hypothetical protein